MNRVDALVEKAANRLQKLANQAAANGGVKAKLADELAEDAAFLRKLKPSLMKARAKGQAPTDQKPGESYVAPSTAQLGSRPPKRRGGGGPNPIVVVGVAFVAGIFLAKVIDWRGHAHPRD